MAAEQSLESIRMEDAQDLMTSVHYSYPDTINTKALHPSPNPITRCLEINQIFRYVLKV